MDEYQQIENLRKLWSQAIMSWMRVGVPVGGALFGFFSYLEQTESSPYLLPLGWLIFVIPMIIWRVMAHHIDRQIVELYPRMLELEQRLGWVTHATYYYNNLRGEARRFLEDRLRVQRGWLTHRGYRQYEQQCRGRRDPYQLLLDAWDEFGHRSVTSRGHRHQDWAVVFIGLASLAIALLLTGWLGCF